MASYCHGTRSEGVFLQLSHHEAVKLTVGVLASSTYLKPTSYTPSFLSSFSLHREHEQLGKHSTIASTSSALTILHRQSSETADN